MSTSKMNLISFKSDQKVTQNNHYWPKCQTPHTTPCQEDNYNPLTVKDFLLKASSAGREEAGERREHAWLVTVKKL